MNAEEKRHQIKFFINKFEATDESEWTTGVRHNHLGQRCALGMTHQMHHFDTLETANLCHLFTKGKETHWSGGIRIATINNGGNPQYQQFTPRQRVLAALNDKLKECL